MTSHSYEHGRRYFDAQERMRRYWSPDDRQAQDLGELLHEAFRMVQSNRLYSSPLDNPKRILDLGTATGLVPLELNVALPDAEIVGTDINPALIPPYSPDNVRFVVEDFTCPKWSFEDDYFDFVHARFLHGAMSYDEWPIFFTKAFKHIAPGGYMESTESEICATSDDNTVSDTCALYTAGVLCQQAAEKLGRPMAVIGKLEGWMKDAGFVDVKVIKRKNPIGRWPKRKNLKLAGDMMSRVMEEGIEGFTSRLLTVGLGMSATDVKQLSIDYVKAIKDRNVHSYLPVYTVYGRKPESTQETT